MTRDGGARSTIHGCIVALPKEGLLFGRRRRRRERLGVAQHPYLLPQTLTIDDAAAPSATLTAVLIVFGIAIVLVIPSLALLYTLAQRDLIAEGDAPGARPR
jgi:hypothetical protein